MQACSQPGEAPPRPVAEFLADANATLLKLGIDEQEKTDPKSAPPPESGGSQGTGQPTAPLR